jgi:hypothetical protein
MDHSRKFPAFSTSKLGINLEIRDVKKSMCQAHVMKKEPGWTGWTVLSPICAS